MLLEDALANISTKTVVTLKIIVTDYGFTFKIRKWKFTYRNQKQNLRSWVKFLSERHVHYVSIAK